MDKALKRNSSFELLRLIAMFSIVIYHLFLTIKSKGYEDTWVTGGYTISHFGVPIFLLITGYFGIKLKLKKIVHLYLYCFCWWIMTFVLGCFYFKTANWGGQIFACIQPFTKSTGQWFLLPYLILMFVSPLLNKAIDNFSKKEYISFLLLFSFIVFYFGLVCQNKIIDKGHSILYFIYMYLLGRYINIYKVGEQWKKSKILCFLMFYNLLLLVFNFALPHILLKPFRGLVFAYIAPGQIISSVAVLILFSKIRIQSKFINYIAASALSVYLFHENIYIPLKGNYALFAYQFEFYNAIVVIIGASLLIMSISLVLDIIFVRTILAFVEPIVYKFLSCMSCKINNIFFNKQNNEF